MNKKYLPLIVLVALAIVWLVAPIVTVSLFGYSASATALDMLKIAGGMGIADILVLFAPIAAIVVGAIAAFAKPAIGKVGSLVTGAAYALGFLLYIIDVGFSFLGWGVYVMLILMAVNVVMNLKAEK